MEGEILYKTQRGSFYLGDSIKLIENKFIKNYSEKINLIITSPPFPLNHKILRAYRERRMGGGKNLGGRLVRPEAQLSFTSVRIEWGSIKLKNGKI